MKANVDHQVRLFVEIANSKSLSAAAEALSLTQSGLSRQLSSLESYIGQPLFVRHGRGVEPTEAGQKLLEAASKVLDCLSDDPPKRCIQATHNSSLDRGCRLRSVVRTIAGD